MVTKSAWLQKENGIPPITPSRSIEPDPWLEPPIQVIIKITIQKKLDPKDAAIEATNRIAYLKESQTPTIKNYPHTSSQANGTTAWACFIKEKDKEIRGRIPKHTPITLAELHAVKAALILYISLQGLVPEDHCKLDIITLPTDWPISNLHTELHRPVTHTNIPLSTSVRPGTLSAHLPGLPEAPKNT